MAGEVPLQPGYQNGYNKTPVSQADQEKEKQKKEEALKGNGLSDDGVIQFNGKVYDFRSLRNNKDGGAIALMNMVAQFLTDLNNKLRNQSQETQKILNSQSLKQMIDTFQNRLKEIEKAQQDRFSTAGGQIAGASANLLTLGGLSKVSLDLGQQIGNITQQTSSGAGGFAAASFGKEKELIDAAVEFLRKSQDYSQRTADENTKTAENFSNRASTTLSELVSKMQSLLSALEQMMH